MRLIVSAALFAATLASPLAAAGVADTHREVAAPAGKINAKAFRPNAQQPCAAQLGVNPSGSRVLATLPARALHGCQDLAANGKTAR